MFSYGEFKAEDQVTHSVLKQTPLKRLSVIILFSLFNIFSLLIVNIHLQRLPDGNTCTTLSLAKGFI